jgi:hypothetical protein
MKAWTRAAYVGVLVLVTGCGGRGGYASKSADDIVKDAGHDMKQATSFRLAGEVTSDGQKYGLDVRLTSHGGCQGEIRVAGGGTAQLVSDGDTAWMKPDHAFWEAAAPGQASVIEQTVGDKWVVVPSGSSSLSGLCDLDSFLKGVDEPSSDKMTNEGADTVDGQDAVKLTGHDDHGKPLTAWVSADAPHYFLRMEVRTGPEPGALTFSEYDEPVKIKIPEPSQVVDLNTAG